MASFAIMGFGTVGGGVAEVLRMNRASSSSRLSSMSLVSAEIVTAAQPLVGMDWLMVSIFAPLPAKIDRTLLNTPGLSFSMA